MEVEGAAPSRPAAANNKKGKVDYAAIEADVQAQLQVAAQVCARAARRARCLAATAPTTHTDADTPYRAARQASTHLQSPYAPPCAPPGATAARAGCCGRTRAGWQNAAAAVSAARSKKAIADTSCAAHLSQAACGRARRPCRARRRGGAATQSQHAQPCTRRCQRLGADSSGPAARNTATQQRTQRRGCGEAAAAQRRPGQGERALRLRQRRDRRLPPRRRCRDAAPRRALLAAACTSTSRTPACAAGAKRSPQCSTGAGRCFVTRPAGIMSRALPRTRHAQRPPCRIRASRPARAARHADLHRTRLGPRRRLLGARHATPRKRAPQSALRRAHAAHAHSNPPSRAAPQLGKSSERDVSHASPQRCAQSTPPPNAIASSSFSRSQLHACERHAGRPPASFTAAARARAARPPPATPVPRHRPRARSTTQP